MKPHPQCDLCMARGGAVGLRQRHAPKRVVVHAAAVGKRPRRWYVYRDSADRALVERPDLPLHLRPNRHGDAWAIVEEWPNA